MLSFKENLLSIISFYKKILSKLEDEKKASGEGSLVVSKTSKGLQIYRQKKNQDGRFTRQYIKKEDLAMARAMAQGAYEEKLRRLISNRLGQLEKVSRDFEDDEIEQVYAKLSVGRRSLVEPVWLSYEEEVARWKKEEYLGLGFHEGEKRIYSNKGERVRSKTEKILADKFESLGIIYKYEKALVLRGDLIYRPDFTFLCPKTRQEIYWEHFGMMDDSSYAINTMKKIRTYEKFGIYRGERLIATYESSQQSLDGDWVNRLIHKYLLP